MDQTSMIGNYIHYKYENYKRYGLRASHTVKDETTGKRTKYGSSFVTKTGNLTKYLDEARREAKKLTINSQAALQSQTLETFLNDFQLRANQTGGQALYSEDNQLQKLIMEHLSTLFEDLQASDFDWSTFTLTPAAKERLLSRNIDETKFLNEFIGREKDILKVNTVLHSRLGSRKSGRTTVDAFKRQIQNLQAARKGLDESLAGATTIQKIDKYIDVLNEAVKNMTSGYLNIKASSGVAKTNSKGEVLGEYSLVELIRATARAIYASAAVALIEGSFFESVLAASAGALAQVGQEGFEQVKKAMVIGSAKGQIAFQGDLFSNKADMKQVLGSRYVAEQNIDGIIQYKIGGQQSGKIDVVLVDNHNQLLSGFTGKSYKLSPKNQKATISFVNATSLLYLFQTKGEFLNHYLNQTVDKARRPQGVITQANEVMKQMILLQSIIGGGVRINEEYVTSQKSATVFALNDKRKPGGIRLVPVSQLFAKLIDAQQFVEIVNFSDDQTWPNTYSDSSYSERITDLLHAVHAKKLHVQVQHQFFTKI